MSSLRSCQHLEIRQRTWSWHRMVNEKEQPERQKETQMLTDHEFKRTRFRKELEGQLCGMLQRG